jgi:Methane oxygenase PmoA
MLGQVKITQQATQIDVEVDGKPFTSLVVGGPNITKPYLHPLRGANGKIVSRVWPMEEKAGEAKDHEHHRGLWFTHGDVNGFDFWANEVSQRKGRTGAKLGTVELVSIDKIKNGAKKGNVQATFAWKDPSGKVLLRETKKIEFHSDPALRIIDYDSTLTAVETVKFGDTKEGMFAVRLTAPLDGKHTGKMISSDGKVGEKQVWGKRAPWVDYVGQLDGETMGVAILDHPTNPKHPTYWHSRDYGLFAANIFGEHDFYNDKTKDGSMTINAGQSLSFRYKVVIHSGDTATAQIARIYDKWAGKAQKKSKK